MAQDVFQKYQSSWISPFPAYPYCPHPQSHQHQSSSLFFKTIFVSLLQKFRIFFSPPIFCCVFFCFKLKILFCLV